MKLVMAIVNRDDAERLIDALTAEGFRATTAGTSGGFLRQGNTTILIGVADQDVSRVIRLIRENCHTRTQLVSPIPPAMEPGEVCAPLPVEVQVGGATIFVLDVLHFEQV